MVDILNWWCYTINTKTLTNHREEPKIPNWCSNTIDIVGPREKIRALWDAAQRTEESRGGLLQAMRPAPRLAEDEWYGWNIENWGTKWDVDTQGLEFEEDEDGNYDNGGLGPHARISGWFDSAWSPPVEACQAYGEANPDVTIILRYYEPGMCFVGLYEFVEGAEMTDFCFDYSSCTTDTVRDMIGEELDDHWGVSEQMAEWDEENAD